MIYFTTYFDKNYLSRGLVLYDSLQEHCEAFELYVLCLDDFTYNFFSENRKRFKGISIINLDELEMADEALASVKSTRSRIEYYFTLSPCLPLYLIQKYNLPHICSLDADILFLKSPQEIFEFLDEFSVVITPHKFSTEIGHFAIYGLYNVSFQIFKNDKIGITCLEHWREQCIEWCSDTLEEGGKRYADQKYLDAWPSRYPGKVKELNDNVSGLAPWNLNNYKIEKKGNQFYANKERIIFYHFHHFRFFNSIWAANGLNKYGVSDNTQIAKLYLKYWKLIEKWNRKLSLNKDVSVRVGSKKNIWENLLAENHVYLKLLNAYLSPVQISTVPTLVKKILSKTYA